MWLSPKYRDTDFAQPLTLDDKITIFLDRTDGWQLGIAEKARDIQHSGFAVLHIILSYFEAVAKYQDGFVEHGQSERYFKQGVQMVFPPIAQIPAHVRDAILSDLYRGARCGLYHAGMTAAHIGVGGIGPGDFHYDANTRRLIIDPYNLTKTLRAHLDRYGQRLRDPANAELRTKFEARFDYDGAQIQGTQWQNSSQP